MATMTTEILRHGYDENLNRYVIVHPLDDLPEEKVDTENLGRMAMTGAVKWSLFSLRAYLIVMTVLVLFRVLQLARVF
jgi:hypothetical protein